MKKFKGTKGEWTSFENHEGDKSISANDKIVANVFWDENATEEENESNAQLIAAAPDLLKALQTSNEWLKKLLDSGTFSEEGVSVFKAGIEANDAAIKKALGE